MRYLALILLLPTFAILAWLYWHFPRALPRSPQRRAFDVAVLVGATIATIVAQLAAVRTSYTEFGPMWPQILASLAAYHVFPLLLATAWVVRARRFGAR